MGEFTLPNEIWLKIFKYIDRRQLMELRLVCHHFNDIIEDQVKWERKANDNILFECRTLIMQRACPYQLVTFFRDITDAAMWRRTYLSYKKWQEVLVNSETIETIAPTSAHVNIACVCTFDKYIAIAFRNCTIAIYTRDDLSQPFYTAYQNSIPRQIEFWYSNGEVLIVTVAEDKVLRFWDLQNKVKIPTKGLFANSISGGECRHFCIGEMNGIITSYERVGNYIKAGPTIDLELRQGSRLIAHTLDGKNMTAVTYAEGCTGMYLYQGIIEGDKLTRFELQQETDTVYVPDNLDATLNRLVMPTITFFFGIGETSFGSTNYYEISFGDGWNEYSLIEHFGCHVRSMTLHAHILMFGLEDGSVHLLYINTYCDVIELKETIKKARKIQVDTVLIVDITILEVNKKPCIVAITNQKVHLLNFF